MDGNKVRTVFQNDGEVSDWYSGAVSAPHLEWPKGSGHRHLDGFTFMVGAKVKITTAQGNEKYITPIETNYREEMDANPVTGEIWGFEPVSGYVNPSSATIAMSNNKNTYPAVWPAALGLNADWNGKWCGYFGKGERDGVLETFYVMDDSRDKEFQNPTDMFYPVASDSTRGGLGLRVEVRGLQFQHQLLEDIIYWNYRVTNISDMDYDSTAFGMFFDPSVGSVLNNTGVNINAGMVYSWSPSGLGLPNNYATGYMGIGVLQSPNTQNGKSVSSTCITLLGSKGPASIWPKNDANMWSAMTGGYKDTSLTNSNTAVVVGSPVFSFPYNITETYSIAMVLANDLPSLLNKKSIAQQMYDNNFMSLDSIIVVGNMNILTPAVNASVAGTVNISWEAPSAGGKRTTYVFITNGDKNWKLIGADTAGANMFTWNSTAYPDGIFYTVRVMSMSDSTHEYLSGERAFVLNNAVSAVPEIKFNTLKEQTVLSGIYPLQWTGGDADGDPCNVSIFVKMKYEQQWGLLAANFNAQFGEFQWDTKTFPNSTANDYEMKAVITSLSDTASTSVSGFSIVNSGNIRHGEQFILARKAQGTGTVTINVVDPSAVTGHPYAIVFFAPAAPSTTVTVTDLTTGSIKLSGAGPIDGNHETKTFDGLRLNITNEQKISIDSSSGLLPGFKTNASFSAVIDHAAPDFNTAWPADYLVEFSSSKKDAPVIADPPMYIIDSVKFTITNLTGGYRCKFLIHDIDQNGSFSLGDTVRILDDYKDEMNFKMCYAFEYHFGNNIRVRVQPSDGDKFLLKTKRPFISGDSIIFTSLGLTSVQRSNGNIPSSISLSQNYPNPFNPATTIRFSIPSENYVDLKVYDVIGKVVADLVHERLSAGEYFLSFDGSRLSSGTYFMRMNVNNVVTTKKLMLLK